MARMVLGIFRLREEAEDAINELERLGYNPRDISIVMRDRGEAEGLADDTGASVMGGTVSGATVGGAVGALAGLLVANGVLPGLGTILIGGPIASALGLTGAAATAVSGATTGALAGSLIGALTSFGLSDDEAKVYESRIADGGIMVAVPAKLGEESQVLDTLQGFGADQIKLVDTKPLERQEVRKQEMGSRQPAYFSEVKKKKRGR
jgi:hypothetical protein